MLKIICTLFFLQYCSTTEGSIYQQYVDADLILSNLKIDNLNFNESSSCSRDIKFLLSSCYKRELWAQLMLDSTGKMEAGILQGHRLYPGRFEECVDTETPPGTFSPQYCLVEINVPSLHSKFLYLADAPIKETFLWGICVPSSCSSDDLNQTLNNFEIPLLESNLNRYVKFELTNSSCVVKDSTIFNLDTIIAVCFLFFIGLINVASTLYDGCRDGKSSKLISSCSAVKNFPNLTAAAKSELGCLGGLVSVATLWAIMGTNYKYQFQEQSSNLNDLITDSNNSSNIIFNNSSLGEDMLLLIAGFMVAITFHRQMQSKGGYDHVTMIIKTYLRWTVPVGMCILFAAYVLPYCGSGPIWNRTTEKLQKSCQQYWFYKLFYVQNYIENVSQCMSQTWLFDVQMQLFWFSPIILYTLLWTPNITLVLSSVMALLSSGLEFYIANENNLGLAFGFSRNSEFLLVDHFKTHCRASPWFIGCTLGIVIIQKRMKGEKFKMSQIGLATGWAIAIVLMISSFMSPLAFDDGYKQPWAALTLATKRLGWGSGIAWVIFVCVTNNAEPVNMVLSWQPFQLFKRISFASILVQDIVMTYKIGLLRDSRYIGNIHMYLNVIVNYVIIFATAFTLALAIQLPTRNLIHLLFKNREICQYPKEPLQSHQKKGEKLQTA